MNNPLIPVGTKVYDINGNYLAEVVKPLYAGDLPTAKDFNPEIPTGTPWQDFSFRFGGKEVYCHNRFLSDGYLG